MTVTDEPDDMPDPADPTDLPAAQPQVTEHPLTAMSKADKLEAKAARMREAEQAKAAAAAVGGSPQRRRTGWVVAVSALSVVTIALAVVLVISTRWILQQRDLNTARTQALQVAARNAVDFGTYDYQTLDADFKKVAAELAPSFAANYAQVTASLKSTVEQYKGKSTATVQAIGVVKVNSPKSVVVVVLLDQTVTTSQSTTARIDRNRLEMTLEKQHGTWLISKLDAK